MTLLKNDGVLPFSKDSEDSETKRVYAVIGPHFNATTDLLIVGGYTGQTCREFGSTDCVPSLLLDGMGKYVDSKYLMYAEGCDGVLCNSTDGFAAAMAVAKNADVIILAM